MDIEGYARRGILKGDKNLKQKLAQRILEIKNIPKEQALKISEAAILESKLSMEYTSEIIKPIKSGVSMGEFGVGSRGLGDFYTHEKIGEIIGKTSAIVDTTHLDDSGVIEASGKYIVVNIDGIHSRLSEFPFLSGFHVARAALRDIYVMGAKPVCLFSDIHIADDGDVAKIFDHIAGITTISELTGVPLITGSTLRIGGDMVIGDRMTGGVGSVGISDKLTSRIQAKAGDLILMTEGAGGGTISTTAIYYGFHDIIDETLNIKFLDACKLLLETGLISKINAMTDVTNGGIRGDAKEISKTANLKLIFEEEKLRKLVNKKVLDMLESLEIDYLGVSIDALLIIVSEEYANEIIESIQNIGVKIDVVGKVVEGQGAELIINGKSHDFTPRFRESAYTPIKKLVGDTTPRNFDEMKKAIDKSVSLAIEKKRKIIEKLR